MGQEIVNYSEEWAKQAEVYAAQEQTQGGAFLSTRGGILKCGEDEFPGNQACVIILDAVFENTYYPAKFDPDNKLPPICYAFGRSPSEMAPHESMQVSEYFEPQSEECSSCPHAVFGSADTGRGKACKNKRRLALINAGFYVPKKGSRDFDLELIAEDKHYQTADIAFLSVPVMSGKIWGNYVRQLSTEFQRPPYGVVTRLHLERDEKDQFHVCFELIEKVPDALFPIISARHAEAMKIIAQGYSPPEEREPAAAGSLKGLRRR